LFKGLACLFRASKGFLSFSKGCLGLVKGSYPFLRTFKKGRVRPVEGFLSFFKAFFSRKTDTNRVFV